MKRVWGFRERLPFICAAAALAIAVCGLASNAGAFQELIPTKIGLGKFGGSPAAGKRYKLVSKAPKPGPVFTLPPAGPAPTGGSLPARLGGKGRFELAPGGGIICGQKGIDALAE